MAGTIGFPAEATPLEVGRKRRRSQVVDLTCDEESTTASPQSNARTRSLQTLSADQATNHRNGDVKKQCNRLGVSDSLDDGNGDDEDLDGNGDDGDGGDDNDDDDDSSSAWDDFVDEIEGTPFVNDGSTGVSAEEAANLRNLLLDVGVDEFFEETMNRRKMTTAQIGVIFNLDPDLAVADEDTFLRILGVVVMRFYRRRRKLPQYNTIDDVADLLKRSRNIMVITGAGISTSLGIPDFRSRNTGFYDKVREKGHEDAEAVFNIENFDEDPQLFYDLAGDILPDQTRWTPTHAFIRLLQDEGRLLTNYTQNIDNIEELAGIDRDRLIQCHGSFATASCRKCKAQVPGSDIFDDIRARRIAMCKTCVRNLEEHSMQQIRTNTTTTTTKKKKKEKSTSSFSHRDFDASSSSSAESDSIPQPGVMKPDITFFGEALPDTFFTRLREQDAPAVDLVLVLGTSLQVAPVSEMPHVLPHPVPHVFVSRERLRHVAVDVQLLGDCDHVVFELARRAGWDLPDHPTALPDTFAVDVLPAGDGPDEKHVWSVRPRRDEHGVAPEGQEKVRAWIEAAG